MLFYNEDESPVGHAASLPVPYLIQIIGVGFLATIQPPGFSGFSKETLDFLYQIRRHNSKPWFEEHRDAYERYLLYPLRRLAVALSSVVLQIDPEIETNPSRVVSRIYRDIRFSHDKSFYKKSMWLTFKRNIEAWQDSPVYYFELFPDSYRFGMGFYAITRETMGKIRLVIEKKPALFRRHLAVIKSIPGMTIEGRTYKRTLNPAIPGELQPIYQKKELYLVANRGIDAILFSEALVSDLKICFGKLAGFYHFLWELKSK
jgi:uncharacterized protein (TIGR02453 family)